MNPTRLLVCYHIETKMVLCKVPGEGLGLLIEVTVVIVEFKGSKSPISIFRSTVDQVNIPR